MKQYENLLLETRGDIGIVAVNRPRALNALNSAALQELDATMEALGRDSRVRVVIVTGNGEKAFVAGADIAEMQQMSPAEARRFAKFGQLFGIGYIPFVLSLQRFRQFLR
jgi:enoyl-CoA hydratase